MICQKQRLENDFAALNEIGRLENGGFTRLAYTKEDLEARNWLQQAMHEAGLDIKVDACGNIRGRRAGQTDLPSVMIGSHLDTVPEGGNYDGIVGVLAGLEVVRALNDHGIATKRPIDIINFSAEESSRFGMATLGSKALCGKLKLATLHELIDKDGVSLYHAIKECGYQPDEIASAEIKPGEIHCFLEMHIEQGPILESHNCPLGIVTSIAAPTRFKVSVQGRADHSGTTPMGMRKDALVAASELVLGVERITSSEAGDRTVGTVGDLKTYPGAMNVVPGKVELGIDIRDVEFADKERAVSRIIDLMDDISTRRDVTITYDRLCHDRPVDMSGKVIQTLKETTEQQGLSYLMMPSGAGHDAMNMTELTDVGMIFIPSVGAISHNIKEFSRMEDIVKGTDVLLRAVCTLADQI